MISNKTPIIIFSSFGNDSVALLEYARSRGFSDVEVAYSNTGWAAEYWSERVAEFANIVKQLGWRYTEIQSEGFKNLVRRKKGFPMNGAQFCTGELKIIPAIDWLNKIDPDKKRTVLVGVRREESQARKNFPEYIESSSSHDGRPCYAPLVDFTEIERDLLIRDFGFTALPHRSMECFPCINANKGDLKLLTEERIKEIEQFEAEMGFTSKGKPRTMFRPYRHMGATGIREVIKWANTERGKYKKDEFIDNEEQSGCESGWCGI